MSSAGRYLVVDIETIHDDDSFVAPEDDRFPPVHHHQIVCIGRALLDEKCRPLRTACPVNVKDEAKLIDQFSRSFTHYGRNCVLVTWNGRGFDVPCIAVRSLRHRIRLPWYNQDVNHRYKSSRHLDLQDVISNYGAWRGGMSLNDAATLCNIPGKTGKGASVADLVDEKQYKALSWYCINDVRVTASVLAVWLCSHRNALTPDEVEASLAAWDAWDDEVCEGGWEKWQTTYPEDAEEDDSGDE